VEWLPQKEVKSKSENDEFGHMIRLSKFDLWKLGSEQALAPCRRAGILGV
jgi:hypothetical protein